MCHTGPSWGGFLDGHTEEGDMAGWVPGFGRQLRLPTEAEAGGGSPWQMRLSNKQEKDERWKSDDGGCGGTDVANRDMSLTSLSRMLSGLPTAFHSDHGDPPYLMCWAY